MGVFLIVVATVFWSLDTLIRYPLLFSGTSASQIVLFEHVILVAVFISLNLFKKQSLQYLKQNVLSFFIIGCCGSALGTLAFTQAFALINPSLVIILQKLQPFVAIALAHFILKEKLPSQFLRWAFFAIIGTILISWTDLENTIDVLKNSDVLLSRTHIIGYVLALVSVLSWGASTVFGKKLDREKLSVEQIMCGRFLYGLVAMMVFMFATTKTQIEMTIDMTAKIVLMVALSGIVGMYLYYKGLKMLSARVVALAELFFPVSAVLINWVFLNKPLNTTQIIGAIILLTSTTYLQFNRVE